MWYTKFGNMGDVILSSRVRLARNLNDFPFPHKADSVQIEQITDILSRAALKIKDTKFFDLSAMSKTEKTALSERHIISPAMIDNSIKRGLVLSDDNALSILINEEDHLRIQAMKEGFNLDECLNVAMEADDIIENSVEYAFDAKLGYLTACPTNVGTGLRASVMACLPGLKIAGKIESLTRSLAKVGITVRGIFGEGSKSLGNIFQISNQVTLGMSEEEIIDKLKEVIEEIIIQERETEQKIFASDKIRLKDHIMRSFGTLKYAEVMTSGEAMNLFSDVRLGINLGIIKETDLEKLSEILYTTLPATLAQNYNLATASERDIKRAEVIKEKLG